MKILIVIAAVCSVMCCKGQVVMVDDSIAFNTIEDSPYSGISECYGIPCPSGTVHCSTRSETSSDYANWVTTVECMDSYGNILNSAVKSSALSSPPFYGGRYNYDSNGYNNGGSYQISNSYQDYTTT